MVTLASTFSTWGGGKLAIICIYINNCLIITEPDNIPTIKEVLSSWFTMKDLSITTSILSIKINNNCKKGCMELCQRSHIDKLLQAFNMNDCNPTSTLMEHSLPTMGCCQIIRNILMKALPHIKHNNLLHLLHFPI